MFRILFVDDEPNVLKGLQRMLHGMRKQWEMHFVDNGPAALDRLHAAAFDVIVSDMRMPGMDGAELLTRVRETHPGMVRIVLSGYADHKAIMRTVRLAHQYVSKPCDADTLTSTIERALALKSTMAAGDLRRLIARMDTLPSLPATYARIADLLRDPDASVRDIGRVIGEDVGMTLKILQLVNSAFYGMARRVVSAEDAAALLGIDTIRALVLTIGIFAGYGNNGISADMVEAVYEHSIETGSLAKTIAVRERLSRDQAEEAYMAGMLHDVGKLVMAHHMPGSYGRLLGETLDRHLPIRDAEIKVFGATHEQVGAYLVGLWGLPEAVAEAVAFHHAPERCPSRALDAVGAVHLADALVHGRRPAGGGAAQRISLDYLERVGLAHRLPDWVDLSREPVLTGMDPADER